ncbi:MAG: ATP-dependent DNA helicase RecG [Oscillospiraceae bacterium]|nr:ATP-dependent DNA helicase RecG [Oscillospiraceae bacterium]
MKITDPIQFLKGVGERRAALLKKLGILCLEDLMLHYPRSYEDWQTVTGIQQAPIGEACCIRAFVDHTPAEQMIRQGMSLFKTTVTDGSGVLGITIFNNPWQAEKLREGEEFLFYGRVSESFFRREMSSPQIAPVEQACLHPVYPLTEGITSRQLGELVRRGLAEALPQVEETLPAALRQAYDLIGLREALRGVHAPADMEAAQAARKRLIFEELLLLQLGLRRLRTGDRTLLAPPLPKGAGEAFLTGLPFLPTAAQLRAVAEAEAEMARAVPMRRLLQGDVGSGKTAVAAALLYSAARSGCQGALMAPTELLARQHHATLRTLFADLLQGQTLPLEGCALLVGSTPAKEKRAIKAGLAAGTLPLVVGTHALLQQDVRFANLGLAVVDEQHRFGVRQREALENAQGEPGDAAEGAPQRSCHMLVMSATPIPRSLAMIIYGDLDISVLDELPPGRTPVATYCVGAALRERAYAYVKKHLDAGRQGYIVCPRVEDDGEPGGLAAAEQHAEQLSRDWFADYRVGLLHGKQKAKQKEETMRAFAAGELQLLVATTVIEVGVDVPNAVIMVIENAERFGLAQLHQLRGRVGRGAGSSTCILISDAGAEETRRRLDVLTQTNDGFAIAREDLRLRGPGEFFGQRQHGLPPLRLADMLRDAVLLEQTREAAQAITEKDAALAAPEHRALARAVERVFAG